MLGMRETQEPSVTPLTTKTTAMASHALRRVEGLPCLPDSESLPSVTEPYTFAF